MKVTCDLCFHHCTLVEGQTGLCRARGNVDSHVVCLNYGKLTALALDPIEKKPLRRFRPGSMILSAGSFGCNLRCPFCQNHEISMAGAETQSMEVTPELLAAKAEELRPRGNIGVAYTIKGISSHIQKRKPAKLTSRWQKASVGQRQTVGKRFPVWSKPVGTISTRARI